MQIFEFLAFNERLKEISARVDFAVKGKKEREKKNSRRIRGPTDPSPTESYYSNSHPSVGDECVDLERATLVILVLPGPLGTVGLR